MSLREMKWFPEAVAAGSLQRRSSAFGLLLLQILFTFPVLYFYHIEENNGLTLLLPWLGAGMLVNHCLPVRFRPLFFILLCAALTWFAVGTVSTLVVLVTVLFFFLLAHLKIPRALKYIAAAVAIAALAAVRLQFTYTPSVLTALPIIGTFMMFRFMLYAYEVQYETKPVSVTERLSYFLNPVNIAFSLFPIVDYKTWIKPAEQDKTGLYAKSTRRILLGVLQLLIYRWVYLHLPAPALIENAGELVHYMLGAYFLILRMLGIFWIAVGLLGYFGYDLPPVADNAFLVPRFSEMWRRINIYWRDFVTKVFYFPIYFRLRKRFRYALILSSAALFVITWLLHAWQWFWIRGESSLKLTDALYWMLLGALITWNLAVEEKRAKVIHDNTLGRALIYMLQIAGVYIVLSALWILWQSATVGEFIYLAGKISHAPETLVPVALLAVLFIASGTMVTYLLRKKPVRFVPAPVTSLILSFACAAVLLLPAILSSYNELSGRIAVLYSEVSNARLNTTDRENAEQGYYEMLVDVTGSSPWEQHADVHGRKQWFSSSENPVQDIRKRTLHPSMQIIHEGDTFTTNRWGMRGPECALQKAPSTVRIAVLGGSYEMGSGVSDEEVFIRIAEHLLNDSLQRAGNPLRVEFLNFSVGGYQGPQFAYLCDSVIFRFQPDAVFYFAHSNELQRLNATLAGLIKNGVDLHYDTLRAVKTTSKAVQGMSRTEIKGRLQPFNIPVLKWNYRHISTACAAKQVPVFWCYVPTLSSQVGTSDLPVLTAYAEDAGFRTLSLAEAFRNEKEAALQVRADDFHPNAKGHALLARHLYAALSTHAAFLSLLRTNE